MCLRVCTMGTIACCRKIKTLNRDLKQGRAAQQGGDKMDRRSDCLSTFSNMLETYNSNFGQWAQASPDAQLPTLQHLHATTELPSLIITLFKGRCQVGFLGSYDMHG